MLVACSDAASVRNDAASRDAPAHSDAPRATGPLVINEAMSSNGSACVDPLGAYPDWVELYNRGGSAIDLTGYTVTDDLSNPTKAILGSGVSVPAGGYTLIWCDGSASLGPDHVGFKLSASGTAFGLYAPDGTQLDAVTLGELATDVSYARIPDGSGTFASCEIGTCGASNGTSCTAPGSGSGSGSGSAGALFVNEVMPSNTKSCDDEAGVHTSDWFELYNSGGAAVSLSGYSVTDDPSMPKKVVLGSGLSIPGHGVTLFFADNTMGGSDGTHPNHVDFALSKNAESVSLYDPAGTLVDTFAWTSAAGDDIAYDRLPDGSGAFVTCMTGTCGHLNGSACPP